MKRLLAVAGAAILLLNACASEETPSEDVATAPDATASENSGTDKKSDGGKGDRAGKKRRRSGGESPGGTSAGSASAEGGDTSEDRDEGSSTTGGANTAEYPAAGTYTFAQSGFEEFCDNAGNCDKEQLPKRQPTRVSYESSNDDSALVLAEQKQSRSRTTTTWTHFGPSGAEITKVHVEFEYSGFDLNRTYEPKPPVEALRFPLRSGESWSGRWTASTSGSYSVDVGARTQVEVGERRVSAYRVETTTEFRGDFEGKSRITVYIDPDTKAIVAAEGALNVTSQFGRYSTVFDTRLRSGPGY